jgi:hypothetical protein
LLEEGRFFVSSLRFIDKLASTSLLWWLWTVTTLSLVALVLFEFWEHRVTGFDRFSTVFLVETVVAALSLVLLLFLGTRRFFVHKAAVSQTASRSRFRAMWGNSKARRVLIFQSQSLLGAGIESLLKKNTELDVHGIKVNDEIDLVREIQTYKPNVIILEEFGPIRDKVVLQELFDYSPDIRVIGVSTRKGQVQVYDKNQFAISDLNDFAGIIVGDTEGDQD